MGGYKPDERDRFYVETAVVTSGVYPRKPDMRKPGPKPPRQIIYTNIEPFKRYAPVPPLKPLMQLVLEAMKS